MNLSRFANWAPLGKFRFGNHSPGAMIGLDIGSQSVTFVELIRRKETYWVERWGQESSQVKFLEEGKIIHHAELRKALGKLVTEHGLHGAKVVMAVNGPFVMTKRIQVPLQYQRNLDEYLVWERHHYFPDDPEDVYFDYVTMLSGMDQSTAETRDVLLVAAKREVVDERVEILQEAGLSPHICDVESLACFNLMALHPEVRDHHSYLLVHIGNESVSMIVVDHQEVMIVRELSGATFACLSDQDRMSSHTTLRESFLPDVYKGEIGEFELLGEMKRTMAWAREIQPAFHIEAIVVSGSDGVSEELVKQLGCVWRMPVVSVNPLSFLKQNDHRRPLPLMAGVASGLALRACLEKREPW